MSTTGLDVEQNKGKTGQQHVKRSLNIDRLCVCGGMLEPTAENPAIQDISASASVPNTEKSQHSNSGCNSGEDASPQSAPTISLAIA
jgi:hypothetical protein